MPHETPPLETCHEVSGSHPNTHTNTCSSSPTPTHTCLVHAVGVQQENTKATDAPLTFTSSQKGHISPHPQTFICLNKHLQDTLCIKFHGSSLHSSLNILFFSSLRVYSWDHTSAFTQQMKVPGMQKISSFPDKHKIMSIISYNFHSRFGGI